jgi:hypothetical protein
MNRDELLSLVTQICNGEYDTEEERSALIEILENNVPDPNVMNLIFKHKPKLTPEEIVEKALSYKPICL